MNTLLKNSIRKYSAKKYIVLLLLVLITLGVTMASLCMGSARVSFADGVGELFRGEKSGIAYRIIFLIRMPRVLGALLAGSALAVSGIILQAVLNNPMAAPNVIGVNAGAGFFVILTMALLPRFIPFLPLSAFLGALLTALLIYVVSSLTDASSITVTLVGIAVGSILTAGINTVKTLFPDSVYDVSGFLIGGLSAVRYADILLCALLIILSLIAAGCFSRTLDVLSLGDEMARGLGVNLKVTRALWLILSAILAGSAVSFSGLIGFVGLIVPHIMRRLCGNVHGYLIPASAFGGGLFLLVSDTVSRMLFAPYELPVGILLSLVGGPFFIFLILSERRHTR